MSDRSEKVKHDFPIRTEDTLRDVELRTEKERGELLMERLWGRPLQLVETRKIRRVFGQIGAT